MATDEFKAVLRTKGKITVPEAVRKVRKLQEGDIITFNIVSTFRPPPEEDNDDQQD